MFSGAFSEILKSEEEESGNVNFLPRCATHLLRDQGQGRIWKSALKLTLFARVCIHLRILGLSTSLEMALHRQFILAS